MQSMVSLEKRPTIGLLFRSFWHSNINRWDGVLKAAQDLDVNLITYIGGILNSPEGYESQSNVLYQMVDREKIDALIIWPLTIGMCVTREEMEAFLRQYQQFPLVSVESSYDGIPSVLQSDYLGLRELIVHLVTSHQISRIAFLRGPDNNTAAEKRYRSYQGVLQELNLPFDKKLVSTPVKWSRGADAIKELLDDRRLKPGIDFEAIIAANSTIMIDALPVLHERGIKIPDDLRVVGFDNLYQSKATYPPLTVAFSNFQDLSRKAVEIALDMLNGKAVPEKTIIPTRLLIRRSCGCCWKTLENGLKNGLVMDEEDFSASVVKERIVAELIQTGIESLKAVQWGEKLVKDFSSELKNSSGIFIKTLTELMEQINVISGEEFIYWQNILSELQRITESSFSNDYDIDRRANETLHQARIIVNEISERKLVEKGILNKYKTDILQEIGASLIATFNLDQIKNLMLKELPRLGIPACYLSLYENSEAPLEWSRLIWAFNQKGLIDIPEGGIRFPSSSLLPDGILPEDQRYSIVVEPLYFEKEQIGFVIFKCGPEDGLIYTVLRTMLSNAIWGANLLQKQQQTEEDLKKKAAELARSNAELEQFAYIVSHDLQEPLRKILAFGERFKKVCPKNLNEKALDYLGRMQSAASSMQGLINDLLSYSRVTTKVRTFEKVNLTEICREVLSDLEPRIMQSKAQVMHGDLPVIVADPLQMRQLFQNLLVNALKFQRNDTIPVVKVYPTLTRDSVEIIIEDNGIGIAKEYQQRIFGVFERLHGRNVYEGSGIGLAICKKIVDRHGGKIMIQSEVEKGSKFIVRLPITRESQ